MAGGERQRGAEKPVRGTSFEDIDTNGDGVLSPSELRRVAHLFDARALDRNGDGYVTRDEFDRRGGVRRDTLAERLEERRREREEERVRERREERRTEERRDQDRQREADRRAAGRGPDRAARSMEREPE